MAKRSSRQISKATVIAASESAASSSRTPAFNPDYSYVAKDLRRIGILAGTFVGILIVLSFFLR